MEDLLLALELVRARANHSATLRVLLGTKTPLNQLHKVNSDEN